MEFCDFSVCFSWNFVISQYLCIINIIDYETIAKKDRPVSQDVEGQ